ncbi:MAG TPA: hemolysin family protein [Bryobacteraceae bacterium]|nr:hemolysin family protein [Bryobacteraceae bacterium]
MIALYVVLLCVVVFLLVLSTLAQTAYTDLMRLRTREVPALIAFKETVGNRLDLKPDAGVQTFSMVKHTLLILSAILSFALVGSNDVFSTFHLLEAFAIAWLLMLVATYIVPHMLYRHTSGTWMIAVMPIIAALAIITRPITALLGFLQSLAQLRDPEPIQEENGSEDIEALITAGAEEGIIEEDDRKLIQSAAEFGTKTVREVMTPRPNIVAISAEATLDDLRQLVITEQFSRIPVYEGNIDNIIGFVHVRDMFEMDDNERKIHRVRELARPIRLVPESKPVDDLLREMQQNGSHMAIVVDEYGNTAGLVTMEDMVEEIVGEIRDEHEPTLDVMEDPSGGYILSGSFDIDHLNDLLEVRLPGDLESTTVGGLASEWLGRVPQPGEVVEKDGIRIEVLAGNELRVDRVRVSKVSPVEELDATNGR